MNNLYKTYICCLMLGCFFMGSQVQAQKIAPEDMEYSLPVINGHPFVHAATGMVNPTFVNTQFDMGIGIGLSGKYEFPLFDTPAGPIYGVAGDMLFANLGFRYKQRLKDWLAFHVSANLNARLGTGVRSILSQGFTVMNGSKLGWLVKIYENDKIYLSTNLYLSTHSGSFISIGGFVDDIIAGVPDPQLSRSLTATNAGVSLNFAWGISKLVGFKALVDVAHGETFKDNGSGGYVFNIDTGFDFNLYPTTKVPLGFYLGYDLNTFPEVVHISEASSSLFISKIAYTGAEDFQLGLEVYYGSLPIQDPETKVSMTNFMISSSFFF